MDGRERGAGPPTNSAQGGALGRVSSILSSLISVSLGSHPCPAAVSEEVGVSSAQQESWALNMTQGRGRRERRWDKFLCASDHG